MADDFVMVQRDRLTWNHELEGMEQRVLDVLTMLSDQTGRVEASYGRIGKKLCGLPGRKGPQKGQRGAVSKGAIAKAMDGLVARGCIVRARQGSDWHGSSVFLLTDLVVRFPLDVTPDARQLLRTVLPEERSGGTVLPEERTVLPRERSVLPEERTVLPGVTSSLERFKKEKGGADFASAWKRVTNAWLDTRDSQSMFKAKQARAALETVLRRGHDGVDDAVPVSVDDVCELIRWTKGHAYFGDKPLPVLLGKLFAEAMSQMRARPKGKKRQKDPAVLAVKKQLDRVKHRLANHAEGMCIPASELADLRKQKAALAAQLAELT